MKLASRDFIRIRRRCDQVPPRGLENSSFTFDFDEHGFVHLGALKADVVGLLLREHAPHLALSFLREADFLHLRLQLHTPLDPLLVRLEKILHVLFHEEFESLRRIVAHTRLPPLLFPLPRNVLPLGDRRLMRQLVRRRGRRRHFILAILTVGRRRNMPVDVIL